MLASALDGHPDIFCASGEPWHRESPWRKYVKNERNRARLLWEQDGVEVSMFKVNWHYLWDARVSKLSPALLAARSNLHVIFLEREDVLAQAVSNEINVRYRYGKIAGHPTHTVRHVEPPTVRLDSQKVAERVKALYKWRDRTRRFIQQKFPEDRALWLTYEELTGNAEVGALPDGVSTKLCNFLDVSAWTFRTHLKKVHRKPYSEIVENWDEIANCLH